MKKNLVAIAFVALISIAWGLHSYKTSADSVVSEALLENLEALSFVEQVEGGWWIFDEIPCASIADEREQDKTYVNCSTCTKEGGTSDAGGGKCTSARFVAG